MKNMERETEREAGREVNWEFVRAQVCLCFSFFFFFFSVDCQWCLSLAEIAGTKLFERSTTTEVLDRHMSTHWQNTRIHTYVYTYTNRFTCTQRSTLDYIENKSSPLQLRQIAVACVKKKKGQNEGQLSCSSDLVKCYYYSIHPSPNKIFSQVDRNTVEGSKCF